MKHLRKGAAIVVALASMASSRAARADDSLVIGTRPHDLSSPQHFAFELRGALYQPRVDSAPGLNGAPYTKTFGDSPQLELAAELDWQALRIPYLGTLGPGLSAGLLSVSAKATRVDNGQPSGEDTGLTIYPFYGVAVLRVDVFERELHVPLVPYIKGGLGVALWRASNSLGTSTNSNGVVGKGTTWGTQFALGIALQLNVFDPHAARELDNSTGVNNTYLFAEYMDSELTGLSQKNALYVGTRSPVFGLAFEF
jgi:hypothetical protein